MPAENMNFSSNLAKNTLRSLVGLKGWDYCLIWKLSEEQRFVEWMDCCCAGTDQSIEDGEVDRHFPPLSPILPCRDVMFQHPRSKSCELLAQLPSSMALDSGIHAQSLISNQPKWLNFSPISDTNLLEETIGTRVLIPIRGGLIELFVTKQVPEDQQVIDFIYSLEEQQEAILNNSSNNMDTCFSTIDNANNNNQPNMMNNGGQLQSSTNGDLPYDITVDRIRLCSPPMNFLHQFNHSPESKITTNNNGDHDHHIFFEGSHDQMQYVDATKEGNDNDSSMKHETRTGQQRSDSVSDNYCSDQNDDDEDDNSKGRRRSGKGPQSKNLIAERRRRKKLNDRLYALRSLVPRISKLDRASILGDAIEFVKELVKQVRELQDELEDHHHRHSDDEDEDDQNSVMPDILSLSGVPSAVTTNKSGFYGTTSISKQNNNQDTESTADKAQQMEPQVEVSQKDVNEFFVKVFCEHKLGGFAKIMEALNSLGLEVTNANVTSFRGLVSNVFHVEKKDSEMVQADNLKESLIELTRNPSRGLWHREMMTAKEVAESNSVDYQQQQHYYHTSMAN